MTTKANLHRSTHLGFPVRAVSGFVVYLFGEVPEERNQTARKRNRHDPEKLTFRDMVLHARCIYACRKCGRDSTQTAGYG